MASRVLPACVTDSPGLYPRRPGVVLADVCVDRCGRGSVRGAHRASELNAPVWHGANLARHEAAPGLPPQRTVFGL